MNYYDFFKNKTTINFNKTERKSNLKFKVANFCLYNVSIGEDLDKYYFIEFSGKDINVPIIMEISLKELWEVLKDYILIGSEIVADIYCYYNDDNSINYMEVKNFKFHNIKVTSHNVISPLKSTNTNFVLLQYDSNSKKIEIKNKVIMVMLVIFFLSMFLIKILGEVGLIIFLLDVVVMVIYSIIRNSRAKKDSKEVFEMNAYIPLNQQYVEICNFGKNYTEKIIQNENNL